MRITKNIINYNKLPFLKQSFSLFKNNLRMFSSEAQELRKQETEFES